MDTLREESRPMREKLPVQQCAVVPARRLRSFLPTDGPPFSFGASNVPRLIGVIEGSGIGPEVIGAALGVLAEVEQVTGLQFQLAHGGKLGAECEERFDQTLLQTTAKFFDQIFAANGAVLNGPRGGRYVYEIRKHLDLFCKFVPVRPWPQLARSVQMAAGDISHVDVLIVRDNVGGVYQGQWVTRSTPAGTIAEHTFSYNEAQVQRLAAVAARAAAARRGRLHVIVKDSGIPGISALWREISTSEALKHGVEVTFINVDLAVYELIRNPSQFDVMLTPNLFGDILVDITGALLGSRGVTFSGNYDATGNAVYQTNHGCAHDLAGSDVANPAGQILSLAMLLRESFGLDEAASLIENALTEAWRLGWRTVDIAEPGCRVVGTKAMADQVAHQVARLATVREPA